MTQAMLFRYTKFPNAAKEYLRFMWEREQYEPWQAASLGYVSHPLKAYDDNKFWNDDPKYAPFKGVVSRMQPHSFSGQLGYASAASLADWIVVDMFAAASTGQKNAKDAAAEAQKRAERYYKV
jgi:multiple sugar transport system substrate-binding protein